MEDGRLLKRPDRTALILRPRAAAWAGALLLGLAPAALQSQPVGPQALWDSGHHAEALDAWAAQLAAHPDDSALRLALAERQLEVSRFSAALETVAPLGAEADPVRGRALHQLYRYEEALPYLRADDPFEGLLLVDALLALDRTDEADAQLVVLAKVRGEDDEQVLSLRGRRLADQGRYADAVPLFRAALALDPLDRQALFGLGQALLRSGQRDEGQAVLQHHRAILPLLDQRDFALQSLSLDPLHADGHAALGDVERQLGLLDSAEQRYRQALKLADGPALVPIALRFARLLAEDRHDPDAAVALLDEVATHVTDPRLAVRAGDVLLEAGRAEPARARFEAAVARWPHDDKIRERLAKATQAAHAAPDAPSEPTPPR
jgi:tetratricopeptide (TPR) repeat protein